MATIFSISLTLKLNKSFLVACVKSLDHFVVFSFISTTFQPILEVLDKSRNQDRHQDGLHSEMIQWNLDLMKCQGTGPIGSLYQGFVISKTLL